MEDFFVVDIPVFVPEYDKDKNMGGQIIKMNCGIY